VEYELHKSNHDAIITLATIIKERRKINNEERSTTVEQLSKNGFSSELTNRDSRVGHRMENSPIHCNTLLGTL